jgi:putative ABC transport system substrate-binding protein
MRRRDFLGGPLLVFTVGRSHAQHAAKLHRMALISPAVSVSDMSLTGLDHYVALFSELRRLGYIEGDNLLVERYSGEGRTENYAELARQIVRSQPDMIFITTNVLVQHFKTATATIPIVAVMTDPIAYGFVENLARPGGNLTGVSSDAGITVWGKRLELLKEVVPDASKIAYLATKYNWEAPVGAQIREAAKQIGVSLIGPRLEANVQEAEYRRVFEEMAARRADSLVVSAESENFANRKIVIALAERFRFPAIYPYRDWVKAGGLMAYTFELANLYRRAAWYVDQILKGAKAGDLPIYQEVKFQFIVNARAAQTIGLTVPPLLLARADEVIE